MDNTFISFSSQLWTVVQKYRQKYSTIPLALRISVSLLCLSLNTASPATKQVASCTLKDPSISKDRGGGKQSKKGHTCFTGGEYHAKIVPSSGNIVALGIAQ